MNAPSYCTRCDEQLDLEQDPEDAFEHTDLGVLICKDCNEELEEVPFIRGSDGAEEQCRWCGNGGDLVLCDVCPKAYCTVCIRRNFGISGLLEIVLDEESEWRCFFCDQEPLNTLQRCCDDALKCKEEARVKRRGRKRPKAELLSGSEEDLRAAKRRQTDRAGRRETGTVLSQRRESAQPTGRGSLSAAKVKQEVLSEDDAMDAPKPAERHSKLKVKQEVVDDADVLDAVNAPQIHEEEMGPSGQLWREESVDRRDKEDVSALAEIGDDDGNSEQEDNRSSHHYDASDEDGGVLSGYASSEGTQKSEGEERKTTETIVERRITRSSRALAANAGQRQDGLQEAEEGKKAIGNAVERRKTRSSHAQEAEVKEENSETAIERRKTRSSRAQEAEVKEETSSETAIERRKTRSLRAQEAEVKQETSSEPIVERRKARSSRTPEAVVEEETPSETAVERRKTRSSRTQEAEVEEDTSSETAIERRKTRSSHAQEAEVEEDTSSDPAVERREAHSLRDHSAAQEEGSRSPSKLHPLSSEELPSSSRSDGSPRLKRLSLRLTRSKQQSFTPSPRKDKDDSPMDVTPVLAGDESEESSEEEPHSMDDQPAPVTGSPSTPGTVHDANASFVWLSPRFDEQSEDDFRVVLPKKLEEKSGRRKQLRPVKLNVLSSSSDEEATSSGEDSMKKNTSDESFTADESLKTPQRRGLRVKHESSQGASLKEQGVPRRSSRRRRMSSTSESQQAITVVASVEEDEEERPLRRRTRRREVRVKIKSDTQSDGEERSAVATRGAASPSSETSVIAGLRGNSRAQNRTTRSSAAAREPSSSSDDLIIISSKAGTGVDSRRRKVPPAGKGKGKERRRSGTKSDRRSKSKRLARRKLFSDSSDDLFDSGDSETNESFSSSDSVAAVKSLPSRRRVSAGRQESSLSEDEDSSSSLTSEEEFPVKSTKRTRRAKSGELVSLENGTPSRGSKRRKRRRLRVCSLSSGSEQEEEEVPEESATPQGRHRRRKIAKIIEDSKLNEETRRAQQEEKERLERLRKKNEESGAGTKGTVERIVLEADPETKDPRIEVSSYFLEVLKRHQVDGVKFLWNACVESTSRVKEGKWGAGAILAHCMGLGKTLQVCCPRES